MKIRSSLISDSILSAVATADDNDPAKRKNALRRLLRAILAFFSLFKLLLARYRPQDFRMLRKEVWKLDEQEYAASFSTGETEDDSRASSRGKRKEAQLKPIGDLGYSGSTFFTTANSKYLIKSLPRRFEHQFFTHDLLGPYISHMKETPHSLLVRITDMVFTPQATLGGIIGTAPTHHIIMENLLYGKEGSNGSGTEGSDWEGMKWETYDLKPNNYFFPERDLADGRLAPDSVIDKLVDEFPDRIRVSAEDRKRLLTLLEADTRLLAASNAIDYSLFLVRYPCQTANEEHRPPVPSVKSDADSWRTGIDDIEGKWTYRLVVLDFFWARHKFHAKAMTTLVKTFNKIAHKGPMSITANPLEYQQRFLGMVKTIVVEA